MANVIVDKNSLHKKQSGFTAVELLVTLFIAAMFLASGYSLYVTVMSRSSSARWQAQADAIAFDYLYTYKSLTKVACTAYTPYNNFALSKEKSAGLGDPTVTVSITCPLTAVNRVSKINVVVEYGPEGSRQNVNHSMYASSF